MCRKLGKGFGLVWFLRNFEKSCNLENEFYYWLDCCVGLNLFRRYKFNNRNNIESTTWLYGIDLVTKKRG